MRGKRIIVKELKEQLLAGSQDGRDSSSNLSFPSLKDVQGKEVDNDFLAKYSLYGFPKPTEPILN